MLHSGISVVARTLKLFTSNFRKMAGNSRVKFLHKKILITFSLMCFPKYCIIVEFENETFVDTLRLGGKDNTIPESVMFIIQDMQVRLT